MTKIEVLYPETCNLFGDMFNIKLLEQRTLELAEMYDRLTGK